MQQATPQNAQDQQEQTMLPSSESPRVGEATQEDQGTSPQVNQTPTSVEPLNPSFFYTQDDDQDLAGISEQDSQGSPFVMPFQPSAGMPAVVQPHRGGAQVPTETPPPPASSQETRQRRSFSPLRIMLIVGSIALIMLIVGMLVLAQAPTPATQPQKPGKSMPTRTRPPQQSLTPTPRPQPTGTPQGQVTPSPSNQGAQPSPTTFPSEQTLSQMGWTTAGLSVADALEAQRTASTFVDREMSFDYRNIGSSTHHSGTLTAATFLLTPGGQVRFLKNDIRMINNTLYNTICQTQLIQQVVNVQPMPVNFQVQQIQGQSQSFVWMTVSFELFQSRMDATGTRVEGFELDSATGKPRVHQMAVVLLRVPPQSQGADAPMGGTGWLVNVYALDATTLPAIATDPSL